MIQENFALTIKCEFDKCKAFIDEEVEMKLSFELR